MKSVDIAWLNECESCGEKNAKVFGDDNTVECLHQDSDVICNNCGTDGYIEVYGPEEVEVIWGE